MKSDIFLARLQRERAAGVPVIVAGVGSGLTAKAAVNGGADILTVYNTAIYRIRGLPTSLAFLPYDNANELTMTVAPEVLANAGDVPVLFGFGAHDPRTTPEQLVARAWALGAAGMTNEPFLGLYGDELRLQLEAAGLGFSREIALLKCAVEQKGMALGWVFSAEQAQSMAEVGVQLIGVVTGVTAGGTAGGVGTVSVDEAIKAIREVVEAVKAIREEVLILGHGGPLNDPASVAEVLKYTGADGYIAGSTGERIPVELSVAQAICQYKSIRLVGKNPNGGQRWK